jgi:HK97 family phage prohead protease
MNMETLGVDLEISALAQNGYFAGYASVFDHIDRQQDIILSGAFTSAVREPENVKLLWQHDVTQPIGKIVHIEEDDIGLYVEGRLLLDVQKGAEAYSLLKNDAISGLSIGYNVKDSVYDHETDLRIIRSIDLYEISLVTFPANERAKVASVKGE